MGGGEHVFLSSVLTLSACGEGLHCPCKAGLCAIAQLLTVTISHDLSLYDMRREAAIRANHPVL
jgi:hypothetical protein